VASAGWGTLRPVMKGTRKLTAFLATAAFMALAATLAFAAPAALSPARTASAGQYCEPGVKQERETTVRGLSTEVAATNRQASRFRKAQLKARKAYFKKAKNGKLRAKYVKSQNAAYKARVADLAALKRDLKRARAQLSSCD
jgi:hypothetical protein